MPDVTPNLGLKKPLGTEMVSRTAYNENLDLLDANAAPLASLTVHVEDTLIDGVHGISTTAILVYYVNVATGSDLNTGLSSGAAFATIVKAISMIPQIVNHTVTINVAAGDYSAEGLIGISGFVGKSSSFSVVGDTVVSTSYIISRILVSRCSIPITVRGFNYNSTAAGSITVSSCAYAVIDFCNVVATVAAIGVTVTNGSTAVVSNSTISNKSIAIQSDNSRVYSNTNGGSSNTTGLSATSAGVIGKNSTQPSGTTAESTSGGGVIR